MEYGKVAGMGTTEQFMKAQTDRNAAAEIVKNATAAQFGMGPAPDKDKDGKIEHFQKTERISGAGIDFRKFTMYLLKRS